MKANLKTLTLIAALSATSHAAIIDVARFKLGETGSLGTNNRPKDSLSTDVFVADFLSGGTVSTDTAAPGSTESLIFGPAPSGHYVVGGNGVFGGGSLGAAPDNFGIEIFVKATAGQGDNIFLSTTGSDLGGGTGLIFELRGGNWGAAVPGNDWIGAIAGAGQTASSDWTSLAVIRENGVSTLYINAVPQPRTTVAQPTFSSGIHFAVQSGGGQWFRGGMDELHVFTFTPGVDNPASALTAVPEPSVSLLLLGGLAALARRRRSA